MGRFRRELEGRRLIVNPEPSELRRLASVEERTTVHGSPSYVSQVRNRSAGNTYVVREGRLALGVGQQPMEPDRALEIIDRVHEYLRAREVIRLDRTMGQSSGFRFHCRLYLTAEFARIAYMWHNTLFPPDDPEGEPDFVSVYVPEWPERIIFVHPDEGVTYILGTDYFGEAKKSFLRMAMYEVKRRGGLGLHAGSKVLRVRRNGVLCERGFIMFGLSGTGKTTLTIHDHGLEDPEAVIIRQDDVVFMDSTGRCNGSENGFFIKTEGLDESQAVLYEASRSPNTIFENVWVDEDGRIDFSDHRLTTNGRAVVLRSEVRNTDREIDLDRADVVIFITRRPDIVPPVARLSPEQAAAFFLLGESIETSAGDPSRAGQSKREVGTNPFIIGPEAEEGVRFLEMLRRNPSMECFLLNTGSVGVSPDDPASGEKITIPVSTGIMREISRGTITWTRDPDWGYEVPLRVPGVDLTGLDPREHFSRGEYAELTAALREERRRWLERFPGVPLEIKEAIGC